MAPVMPLFVRSALHRRIEATAAYLSHDVSLSVCLQSFDPGRDIGDLRCETCGTLVFFFYCDEFKAGNAIDSQG